MKSFLHKIETLLEWGGVKKDVTLLVLSGAALIASMLGWSPFPFDMAWAAIILCGVPILTEALIGLLTAFDIKADVLVSLALVASVCIGEDFAAGGHREAGASDPADGAGAARRHRDGRAG